MSLHAKGMKATDKYTRLLLARPANVGVLHEAVGASLRRVHVLEASLEMLHACEGCLSRAGTQAAIAVGPIAGTGTGAQRGVHKLSRPVALKFGTPFPSRCIVPFISS